MTDREHTQPASDQRILVTSALPYANGSIHIGHLVEYLQTDIYVRFLRMTGRDVIYCCADDTHGTPIELKALELDTTPEELVGHYSEEHQRDFGDFLIAFDSYYSTHSPENRHFSELIYGRLRDAGLVERRPMELTYCTHDERFLPDRMVRGTCPVCKAEDQYGDSCEFGHTYEASEVLNPRCTICGNSPERRTSEHLFLKLSPLEGFLREWMGLTDEAATNGGRGGSNVPVSREVRNQMASLIEEGLKDWCISRDGPYFGFTIPDFEGKYFYVWLDAPIGYIASTAKYCKTAGCDPVDDYWGAAAPAKIIHFIGKDITRFHVIFWPAVLKAAGFHVPDRVVVHGFLTVNGEKMSKRRGTFITARRYLDHLDPEFLRYYYAAHLGPGIDDIDLSLEDFRLRTNAELVNNVANLWYRVLSFAEKRLDGHLSEPGSPEVMDQARQILQRIETRYSELDFRRALQEISALADLGNSTFQNRAPWALIKEDTESAREVVTLCAQICRMLAVALWPVAPKSCESVLEQMGLGEPRWDDLDTPLTNHRINQAQPVLQRLEAEDVEKLISAEEEEQEMSETAEISFDDFLKVDLRVGKILSAQPVPKTDALYELEVDIGEARPRTLVAGIRQAYEVDELIDRLIIVVSNLAPRKVRGVLSQGMLLASGDGGEDVTLMQPGPTARVGDRIH